MLLSSHCPKNPNPQQIQFASLNVSCLNIKMIDNVRPSFYFISHLYLDHNSLKSLNGIQQFVNLETLSFNFNFVEGFHELNKIKNKFFIQVLSFIGNPLQNQEKCTEQYLMLHVFTNLKKLNPLETCSSKKSRRENNQYNKYYKIGKNDNQTERYPSTDGLYNGMILQKTKRGYGSPNFNKNNGFIEKSNKFGTTKKFMRSKNYQNVQKNHNHSLNLQFNQTHHNSLVQSSKRINRKQNYIGTSTTAHGQSNSHLNRSLSHQFQYTFDFQRQAQYSQHANRKQINNVKIKPFQSVIEQLDQSSDEYSYQLSPSPPNQDTQRQMSGNNTFREVQSFDQKYLPKNFKKSKKEQLYNRRGQVYERDRQEIQSDLSYNSSSMLMNSSLGEQMSLAAQFLEEKKIQISIAYRIRFLKQKFFEALLENCQNSKLQKQIALKKAWGAVKLFQAMQKAKESQLYE